MAKLTIPPDQNGYSFEAGVEVLSVELAGGAPRIRLDQLGAWGRLSCAWTVGREDFTALVGFYRDNKSVPFTMDLIIESPDLTEHHCMFVPGSWKAPTLVQGYTYRIECELFVNPIPVSEEPAAVIEDPTPTGHDSGGGGVDGSDVTPPVITDFVVVG